MRTRGAPLLAALLAAPLAAFAAPPLAVEIVTVELTPETRTMSLTGELVARNAVDVAFPMGGRLAEVLVEAGDKVAAGAVLARLDAVQQNQARLAAEAARASAEAAHRQAREDFSRQERLLERGATTRIARDAAEDALHIAAGGLVQAEASLAIARKAVADTVLKAPEAATVIDRNGEPGEVVGAAQPVFELALGDALDAVFDVPEARLIAGGPPPTVRLKLVDAADPGFSGQVREVSPLVDAALGTVRVKVGVNGAPKEAGFGRAVIGTIDVGGPPGVALPREAIASNREGLAVWVVDPETMSVSMKPVAVKRYESGRVILAGGLTPGMKVVAKGASLLFPGRVVRAAEAGE